MLLDKHLRSVVTELSGLLRCARLCYFLARAYILTFFYLCTAVLRIVVIGSADTLSVAKECGSRASELVTLAADLLSTLRRRMYPYEEIPQLLGELVGLFHVDDNPIHDFSRVQTKCGTEAALLLSMGHGVVDEQLEKITSEFLKGSDGRER